MSAINARCGVSQQSIAAGDPCRVVVITQSASFERIEVEARDKVESMAGVANTTVYPNCFWRPEGPFLRAVYDDYGLTQLVLEFPLDRAQAANLFFDLFRADVRTRAGKNPYHDLAFNFTSFVQEKAPGLTQKRAAQAPSLQGGVSGASSCPLKS